MKKFSIFIFAAIAVMFIGGCCCVSDCCPMAKYEGKWQIFVQKGGKLEGLPVSPQPIIELQPAGKMVFHYSKDGKKQSAAGLWKVDADKLIISSADGKKQQKFTIDDDELVLVVGKGDALPEKTVVVLQKADTADL